MSDGFASRRATGILLAFLCLLLLGVMPVISNGRPAEYSALGFAFGLTVWQLLFSLPLYLRERSGGGRQPRRAKSRSNARVIAVLLGTGFLFAVSTLLYVVAFQTAGSVNAAIALQAYPLMAMALESVLHGKRRSLAEIAFTALIVAALYYLATGGTFMMRGVSAWFLLALAVPALWSVAHVTLREMLAADDITPNAVVTTRLVVSALFLLPVLIGMEGLDGLAAGLVRPEFAAAAALMGLVYYVELILWFNAVRFIDVSVASSVTVPAPAVTAILAFVLLGEAVYAYQVAAMAVVIAGLYGLLRAGARQAAR
ncbi:DMT family transporter [Oricola sp.]|uniref:DMT family transporter n=1 Tax=Oricola sp. TaxID=1979950 RepID=UPI003BACA571